MGSTSLPLANLSLASSASPTQICLVQNDHSNQYPGRLASSISDPCHSNQQAILVDIKCGWVDRKQNTLSCMSHYLTTQAGSGHSNLHWLSTTMVVYTAADLELTRLGVVLLHILKHDCLLP